jgi:serine/threonine protein kinase
VIRYPHGVVHVCHRDLKASNFMFARPGDVRSVTIIDMGLSKHVPPKRRINSDHDDDDEEEEDDS